MIKTRLLAKAKNGSSGGSVTLGASGMSYTNGTQYAAKAEEANTAKTAQYADTAGSADEAKHAASAAALDEKAAAALDEKYLSKVNADTAAGKITFADGMALGDGTAYGADKDGAATMKSVTAETIAASTSVGNSDFVSGYAAGSGWSVYSTLVNKVKKWTLEIDNLVVRSALKVYEMVVSQLVGENDNRIFAACGEVVGMNVRTLKIYVSTENGGKLNPFRVGDVLECQQYQPNGEDVSKHYRLIVRETGTATYKKETCAYVELMTNSDFTDLTGGGRSCSTLVTAGDTLVRVDSTSDESRKGIVGITSVGEKTPYLDVIYGKTTETNPLKVRLGNLSGVTDDNFGGALSGWGLYAENAYLKGAVHADSGYFKGEIQATSGTFTNGTFENCTSKQGTFEEGTFNKGTFTDITAVNGTFENGTFTNANVEGTISASALRLTEATPEAGADATALNGSLITRGDFILPELAAGECMTIYYSYHSASRLGLMNAPVVQRSDGGSILYIGKQAAEDGSLTEVWKSGTSAQLLGSGMIIGIHNSLSGNSIWRVIKWAGNLE